MGCGLRGTRPARSEAKPRSGGSRPPRSASACVFFGCLVPETLRDLQSLVLTLESNRFSAPPARGTRPQCRNGAGRRRRPRSPG